MIARFLTMIFIGMALGLQSQDLQHRSVYRNASLPEMLTWHETAVRSTEWLTYRRFQGFLQGIEVEGADAVVSYRTTGEVDVTSYPILPSGESGIHFAADSEQAVWLIRGDQWTPALRTDQYEPSPLRRMRYWLDGSGRVIDSLDLIRHGDTVLPGKVFRPDPLSKANVPYGGIYVDGNDGNTAVLDSLRTEALIPLSWNGSAFVLANSAAVIQEFDPPSVTVPILNGPRADFSRSAPEFEMLNTLYHVAAWKQYMTSLGYAGMVNYAIPVDVNAYGGADQSAFDFGTTPPRLYFGEGGVDDAEDSDVIVHEYGHAMAYGAAPGTNIGIQRQALEEALCDYWAVAWSIEQNSARTTAVFTWDGHNEFWSGRSATNSQQKMYPSLTFTGPYSHTAVLVDALVRGRQRVGGAVMDGLVMEALYSLTASTTFRQFAEAVLHADTIKHNAVHASGLHSDFGTWQILLPGMGLESDSRLPANGAVYMRPGSWPTQLVSPLHVWDASGRMHVLTNGANLPASGWYVGSDGLRIYIERGEK